MTPKIGNSMSFYREYLAGVKMLIDEVSDEEIEKLTSELERCWNIGAKVILMGNGGSSATASHIVNDLQKCIHLESGKPVKSICLTDCTPLIMAWANDTEFADIFSQQI